MAWAVDKLKRSVTIAKQTYYGIRTELTVQVGEAKYGGKAYKKAFTICITKDQFTTPGLWDKLGDGLTVTDDIGATWTVSDAAKDAIQVTLTCVGAWG